MYGNNTTLKDAVVKMISPIAIHLRNPIRSAKRPVINPSVIPAICTEDSKNPASTKSSFNSFLSRGSAGEIFQICIDEKIPAITKNSEVSIDFL
ncbi:hypothetical protein GCM10007278_19410 [Paenalcaligenes hominis]|nr:hypothetical protein GCM10007278_19410 [Paenalcaligenes hominis]